MAIKIVLTDEDALAWAGHVATQHGIPYREEPTAPAPEPATGPLTVAVKMATDAIDTDILAAAGVNNLPPKRGRPRREPVPKDEAGPVIPLPAEAVTDADPLDLGIAGQPSLVTSDDDLDLDLDGPLTALIEYSDAEMAAAAAKFVTTKREPGNRTFRLILGKYATQVADIPQDRRQAFLDELKGAA